MENGVAAIKHEQLLRQAKNEPRKKVRKSESAVKLENATRKKSEWTREMGRMRLQSVKDVIVQEDYAQTFFSACNICLSHVVSHAPGLL